MKTLNYIIEKTDSIWSQTTTRSSRGEIKDRRDIIITGKHLSRSYAPDTARAASFGSGRSEG
ncbi:MAG: hypothetical protein MZV63_55305 [Marinilabiliales bacterium]|nr:hypothetical protein [Marinilabiliales bacterium]